MRKITCALLALLIVAALLPVSAAAACDHSFYQAEAYKATCTEDGYYKQKLDQRKLGRSGV